MTGVSFGRYFEATTIHGFRYLNGGLRARVFWGMVIAAQFSAAGYWVSSSYTFWQENPLVSTEKGAES